MWVKTKGSIVIYLDNLCSVTYTIYKTYKRFILPRFVFFFQYVCSEGNREHVLIKYYVINAVIWMSLKMYTSS
jgi:hypothetical protein